MKKKAKSLERNFTCQCSYRVHVILIASVFIIIGLTGISYSFHSGMECWECHNNHKSSDPTSTCLTCHKVPSQEKRNGCLNCHPLDLDAVIARTPVVFSDDGSAMTPGGDFFWLKKNFAWTSTQGVQKVVIGDNHGHNIISKSFDLSQDGGFSKAPYGTYPSSKLTCCSCHNPHEDRSKTFRLLGGASYNGMLSGFSFSHDAPIAASDPSNRYIENEFHHVAYGSGMSEWCSNCHVDARKGNHSHPTGKNAQMKELSDKYNTYSSSGYTTNSKGTAYLFLVPFETGSEEASSLDPLSMSGPGYNANVMCLSCHRAHASAFSSIGRWDFDAEHLHESHPAKGDIGVTDSDAQYSYYGIDVMLKFGDKQKSLCNKCHLSD
jgi:hypothetical protein